MSELQRWIEIILDEGVPGKMVVEFEKVFKDVVLATAFSEEDNSLEILGIISFFGDESPHALRLRVYLAYIYGKMISSGAFSGVIGMNMMGADEDVTKMLNDIIDEAMSKVITI